MGRSRADRDRPGAPFRPGGYRPEPALGGAGGAPDQGSPSRPRPKNFAAPRGRASDQEHAPDDRLPGPPEGPPPAGSGGEEGPAGNRRTGQRTLGRPPAPLR